jgi:hypothetical protein
LVAVSPSFHWFSASFHILKTGEASIPYLLLSILAVGVPIGVMAGYIKLMPVCESNLQKLSNHFSSTKYDDFQHALLYGHG